MHGSLSIEKRIVPWSRADRDGYVVMGAIGVLAGIAVAYGRMPLQMPGHKVLFWMIPVLTSRLLTRVRAGASVGAFTTSITTLSLGGRIAGGAIMVPMILFAGIILDGAVHIVEERRSRLWLMLLFLALAGTVGNLLCLIKRLFDPTGPVFSTANLTDLLLAVGSYAFFGFLAGLCGAAIGYGMSKVRMIKKNND
jgi:hypothetical protein